MKVIGAIIVVLALVVGILPQFTDCLAQGKAIELPNGATMPMKCHWTRQAEVAIAIPLGLVGILTVTNKRRQTLRALSILAVALGLGAILLPAYLIGVCASEEMICSMVMRPSLLFAGVLVMGAGLVGLIYLRGEEPGALPDERAMQAP
jgi:hypothetical protein